MSAFVEPPMAALTRTAFSNALRVRIRDGRSSSSTIRTTRCPAACAISIRRESTAGQAAEPGSCMPSASAMQAIVEAVPIVMQCPLERAMRPSAKKHSSSVIRPVFRSSSNFRTWVPDPTSWPRYLPLSIGPPVTMTAGRPTLAAPMSMAGVVLSQPDSSTTPSSGLARISSSTSMAMRLRYSMAVGRIRVSPVAMVGNWSRRPPACHTPRLTASATCVRWALHGASSEALVAIPMTGRPSNTSCPSPWLRIQERYGIPLRPCAPNHAWLRRLVL